MKTILTLAFSLLVLPLSAQDEGKAKSPAERLLEVTEFKKTITKGGDAGFAMIEKQLEAQNLTKEEMAEVKTAFMDYMDRVAEDPELLKKTTALYNEHFTPDELEELIVFYKTPLGQKTLSSLPDVMSQATQYSTAIAQKHVGPFQEALTKILEKKAQEENKEDKE